MSIDWVALLTSPLALIIFACVVVTVVVILIYAVKVKNKAIDFLWTGLLLIGIGMILRFGLLELIPEFPEQPLLDVTIGVFRWVVSMFGVLLINKPVKLGVGKLQDMRSNYNRSE